MQRKKLNFKPSQPTASKVSKCNYYREAENEMFVPSCGVESGEAEIDVHPEDVMEWVYCPFCGGKIKLINHKRHPDLYDDYDYF